MFWFRLGILGIGLVFFCFEVGGVLSEEVRIFAVIFSIGVWVWFIRWLEFFVWC